MFNTIQAQLAGLYQFYLIEYLLLSNKYEDFINANRGLIPNDFIDSLECFIKSMSEEQIYPLFVIDRMKEFVNLLSVDINDIDNVDHINNMNKILNKTIWLDSTEVYNREYIARYASIKNSQDFHLVTCNTLYKDMQKDFLNLEYLIKRYNNDIPDDFLYTLNRLIYEVPEVVFDRRFRKRIISILNKSNFLEKDIYIKLMKDKTKYRFPYGFNLTEVENLYISCILYKLFYSGNVKKDLENISLIIIYSDSFIVGLTLFVSKYVENNSISQKTHNNLREILSFMRNNISEIDLYNKEAIIQAICSMISKLNIIQEINNGFNDLVDEYTKRIGTPLKLITFNIKVIEHARISVKLHIDMTVDVFEYLFGKLSLADIYEKDSEEMLLLCLKYLYENYPRMFFDKTLNDNVKTLLDTINNKDAHNLKRKINKIR